MIGYFSDESGSQRYPAQLRDNYPDQGNFIAFVGNLESKNFVRQCAILFRVAVSLPCQEAVFPSSVKGVDWSDHWSFWQEGYPALMVTDTALYRYPHYHRAEDTPDKIDYQRTAQVVEGMRGLLRALTIAGG